VASSSVRNLAELQQTASTSRVLNLLRVGQTASADPEYAAKPFFRHPHLNNCIVLKHRLRRNEVEAFRDGRQTATKVVIPIDGADLRLGGRSVFVGQNNYQAIMRSALGERWESFSEDRALLDILDELPSFDPFLLRENLKRHGREPARCYFEISDGDLARMHRFVEAEIYKLIELCFAGDMGGRDGAGSKLVRKILSNSVDADTEPLRLTLRLDRGEYQEGVFCWKGFLYYKWTLAESLRGVEEVAASLTTMRPRGQMDADTRVFLQKSRETLADLIMAVRDSARQTLKVYDNAFNCLVEGQPAAFREFLLGAPSMFSDLGERLGAVQHIVSFWTYRFPAGKPAYVTPEELSDIFQDFEASLSFPELKAMAAPARRRPPPTPQPVAIQAAAAVAHAARGDTRLALD
jgi:hypothetical protein